MDDEARAYIDAIDPAHRPLFDRVHDLVIEQFPEARIRFAYKMPTFTVGKQNLYLGAWKHGVSIYGITPDRDGGFGQRHPELRTGKGTLRLTAEAATRVGDDEIISLIRAALGPTSDG